MCSPPNHHRVSLSLSFVSVPNLPATAAVSVRLLTFIPNLDRVLYSFSTSLCLSAVVRVRAHTVFPSAHTHNTRISLPKVSLLG